ncbi:oligopeptidase B, partial [Ornithobacterium rhinotracheale]
YYTRTEDGKDYYIFCRKMASLDAPEEILLDLDEMSEGIAYFYAKVFYISPINELFAFGLDEVSRGQYKIFIKDL